MKAHRHDLIIFIIFFSDSSDDTGKGPIFSM